jgi:hypothetical protein
VIDRRESRIPPFSEVSAAIQAREQERVFRDEVAKYMTELEKKSLIVANPPEEAAGFRRQIASAAVENEDGAGGLAGAEAPAPPASPALPADIAPVTPPGSPGTLPTPKPVDITAPPVEPPPPGL